MQQYLLFAFSDVGYVDSGVKKRMERESVRQNGLVEEKNGIYDGHYMMAR